MQQPSVGRSRGPALTAGIAIGVIVGTLAAGSITGAGGVTGPVISRGLQFKVVSGPFRNTTGLMESMAFCPRGWNVLNGGFKAGGATLQMSLPGAFGSSGQAWTVRGLAPGDHQGYVQASAVCVRT